MRKILSTLCAAVFSLSAVLAGERQILTPVQGTSIDGLQVGSVFTVVLRQDDNPKNSCAQVTIDARLEPYLKAELRGGILTLGFRDLPRELQNGARWSCRPTAEITVASLDRLIVSGMADIRPEGTFTGTASVIQASGSSRIGPLEIVVTGGRGTETKTSGMSRIDNLILKNARSAEVSASGSSSLVVDCGSVSSLDIEVSGMSRATVEGGAPSTRAVASGSSGLELDCGGLDVSLEIETSGMSRAEVRGGAPSVRIEASGSSGLDFDGGTIGRLDITTSGMASVTGKGRAETVEAAAGGSSHIRIGEVESREVVCEASGMGGITCYPTRSLEAAASGSSSIRYRTDGPIRTVFEKSNMGSIEAVE